MVVDALTTAVGRSFPVSIPVLNQSTSNREIALSLLPSELSAVIGPDRRVFNPLEQFLATLEIKVPAGVHGTHDAPVRKDVTVVGRGPDGSVIDGVTVALSIND
jgi:hypothetical protein